MRGARARRENSNMIFMPLVLAGGLRLLVLKISLPETRGRPRKGVRSGGCVCRGSVRSRARDVRRKKRCSARLRCLVPIMMLNSVMTKRPESARLLWPEECTCGGRTPRQKTGRRTRSRREADQPEQGHRHGCHGVLVLMLYNRYSQGVILVSSNPHSSKPFSR